MINYDLKIFTKKYNYCHQELQAGVNIYILNVLHFTFYTQQTNTASNN
jgi:hypothetical protein